MPDVTELPAVEPLAAAWVMRLQVVCGDEVAVGDFPEGRRLIYPIIGGHFEGDGLRGEVLPGGADWYLDRRDGPGQPDARYSLRTDDGIVIQVSNRALLRYAPGTHERDLPGWPPDPALYRCLCTPQFQAPAGRCGWLNASVFVGEIRYPHADSVSVDVYRLL